MAVKFASTSMQVRGEEIRSAQRERLEIPVSGFDVLKELDEVVLK